MDRPALPPGPCLVVGLARSGRAALGLLQGLGIGARGVDRSRGDDGVDALDGLAWVVKSPGVPREAPVIAEALARGMPVMGELELAWRVLPNAFIAVTGTNGKTTTVQLLGAIHREAGVAHEVVGNVGTAVSGVEVPGDAVLICECSSFQLEDTLAFAPDAAVLLNVEPDHLDRHGSLAAYEAAKLEAFARQSPDQLAVAWREVPGLGRRVVPAPYDGPVRLRGPHNAQNVAAAVAVARARGVPEEAIRAAVATFAGVAHRLEEIAEIDGVLFVNDSKATNVASALVALRAFDGRRVHAILGGQGKGQDFAPLGEALGAAGRAYLIGEDAERIAASLGGGVGGVVLAGTLERAVAAARAAASLGDVVLLAPACASFDQYADFEARGDAFRALVTGSATP